MILRAGLCLTVLALIASALSTAGAAPSGIDIYQYAGECMRLRDTRSGRYVAREGAVYVLRAGAADAVPFRMQATALGSYLLYGPGGAMPATEGRDNVGATEEPGPKADWRLGGDEPLRLTSVQTGRNLAVSPVGQLIQDNGPNARWSFEPATGCDVFPEIDASVDGTPLATPVGQPVQGLLDAHVHPTAFDFLGGRVHCGRPWSPYGVTVALKDCPDHAFDGAFALIENLLSHGTVGGRHSTQGWPDFDVDGWPRYDSLTHEGTYWKGIERSWRAGLRIMVADLVENRALCELYYLKQNPCTDMASMHLQAQDLYALQDYIDAQYKGPGKGFFRIVKSPAEARQVISEGKLAVVMGMETSQPFDCLYQRGRELCTKRQIDQGLREVWDLGVRSMFIVHKFDNAFGGTAMDDGVGGLIVNFGNKWMTGNYWEVEPCPTADHDHQPVSFTDADARSAVTALGHNQDDPLYPSILRALLDGPLPSYPPGLICNVRGLTDLGEYLVNRMIDMGMIVETDHLSVKTRARVMEILAERQYSGVVTSHTWGDDTTRHQIQALGGIVAFHVNDGDAFVDEWQDYLANQPPQYYRGLGFGTDTNGLSVQAQPRAGPDPVTYPFAGAIGSTTVYQSQWGNRLWSYATDGAAHYGLYADWIEDIGYRGGPAIVQDLARGAEAYLQMWERATGAAPAASKRAGR